MNETGLDAVLPVLGPREAWAVGAVLVLTVLRPAGKLGWSVAGVLLAGGVGVMAVASGLVLVGKWQLIPWIVLAVILAATAAGSPLRWEPRTGPSAATALAFGAIIFHVGIAWTARAGGLAAAGDEWMSGRLDPGILGPDAVAPLAFPLVWLLSRLPGIDAAAATAALSLAAATGMVLGAGVLARGWGYTGTSRAASAAVAWAPPLLLAHAVAPATLLAGAALLWAWWALGEVWAGRHLPVRMALMSGLLLGAATGLGLWPLLVAPLWLRRLSGRKLAWFSVGALLSLVVSVAALVPTAIGLADVWQMGVLVPVEAVGFGSVAPLLLVVAAFAAAAPRVPLSPTRLSAATGALLALMVPWWPVTWALVGAVLAVPFVILAAVAPDHPQEHWPPDAPLPAEDVPAEVPG